MQQILLEYRPKLFSPSRSGPYIIGDLTIVPGVKNYDLQKWEALQSQPHLWTAIQSCLDNGILRIISQSSGSSKSEEIPTLPKNQTEAVALVKRTFAVSLLKSWLESENRPTVKNAINSQLKLAEEDKKPPATETKEEEE